MVGSSISTPGALSSTALVIGFALPPGSSMAVCTATPASDAPTALPSAVSALTLYVTVFGVNT